jgi:hypothetical protein
MHGERDTATRRLRYQRPDSDQTLAEALVEYYAANAGRILPPDELSPESAALFRSHDICHVIFGLDTSLADEALADTRTMLSCDVGLRRYTAYLTRDPHVREVFREAGYLRTLGVTVLCLPRVARAAFEALRVRKRWPWRPPAGYAERRLSDLRDEYGIRLV